MPPLPALAALLERPPTRACISALLCAAVAEINRGLAGVTDAEERRALLVQLYALSEPAPPRVAPA